MKLIEWTMLATFPGALWLASASESGFVGTWADGVLCGIFLLWAGLAVCLKAQEREEKRKAKRALRKAIGAAVDEINRQRYIRETMAA